MRMNHVNLPVADVSKSRALLETYFGLRCVFERDPEELVVLIDENKCAVTLSNFKKVEEVAYPSAFHIGFFQSSREEVDAIHHRLERDGLKPGPRKDFHGAWTFYLKTSGGLNIEVGHQYELPNAA